MYFWEIPILIDNTRQKNILPFQNPEMSNGFRLCICILDKRLSACEKFNTKLILVIFMLYIRIYFFVKYLYKLIKKF